MSGGSLSERRPLGYFGAFNKWWNDFFLQNGRRPNKTDIETWRAENPTWRPELSLDAIVQHSKGRRDPEKNRQYFVEYRRKIRGSAKRPARRHGRGRRTARKVLKADEPWEEVTSDDDSEGDGDFDLALGSSPRRQQPRRCRADAPAGDDTAELLGQSGDEDSGAQHSADEPAAPAQEVGQRPAAWQPEGAETSTSRAAGNQEQDATAAADGGAACPTTASVPPLPPPQAAAGEALGAVMSMWIPIRRTRGPTSAATRLLRCGCVASAKARTCGEAQTPPDDSAGARHTHADGGGGHLGPLAVDPAAAAAASGCAVSDSRGEAVAGLSFGAVATTQPALPVGHNVFPSPPSLSCAELAGPATMDHALHSALARQAASCPPPGLELASISSTAGHLGPTGMPWWPGFPSGSQCWMLPVGGAPHDCLAVALPPMAPTLSAQSGGSEDAPGAASVACASTMPFYDNDLQRTGSTSSIGTSRVATPYGAVLSVPPAGMLSSGSETSALASEAPHTATGGSGCGSGVLGSPSVSGAGEAGAPAISVPPPAKRQRIGEEPLVRPLSPAACDCGWRSIGALPADAQQGVPVQFDKVCQPFGRPEDLSEAGTASNRVMLYGAPCGLACGSNIGLIPHPAAGSSGALPASGTTAPAESGASWPPRTVPVVLPQGHSTCADAQNADFGKQQSANPVKPYRCCDLQLGARDADGVWVESLFVDDETELRGKHAPPTALAPDSAAAAAAEIAMGADVFEEDAAWSVLMGQDLWGSSLTDAFNFTECI